MKKIVLLCASGMSTSMLVKKMQEAAKADAYDCEIAAFSASEAATKAVDADVVLLGPQIRHMLGDVQKVVAGKCPTAVIDMRDYGMIRGDKVLDKALSMATK